MPTPFMPPRRPEDERQAWQQVIQAIRQELRWSRQQMADYLSVTMPAVYRWEMGEREISPIYYRAILALRQGVRIPSLDDLRAPPLEK